MEDPEASDVPGAGNVCLSVPGAVSVLAPGLGLGSPNSPQGG